MIQKKLISLLILSLLCVGSFSQTFDDETQTMLVDLINKVTNPEHNVTTEFNSILKVIKDVYTFDKCIEDARLMLNFQLLQAGFLADMFVLAPFQANRDCIDAVNIAQYTFVEISHLFGYNATYSAFKDQLVNTTSENPTLRTIVSSVENINAFYSCVVGNLKFIVAFELIRVFTPFDTMTNAQVMDLYNRFGLHFGYNIEQCAVAGEIVREAWRGYHDSK